MIAFRRITQSFFHFQKVRTAVFINGTNIHPNPRLYKYYWWIYSANSEFSSAEEVFYKSEYRLSMKAAMDQMADLQSKNIPYAYVNSKIQRLGCKIWNYASLEQQNPNIKFALAYDEDLDPEYEGYK